MAPIWIWITAAICCFQGSSAVYFAQERPVLCLPSNSRAGTFVGRLFAYQNSRDNCTSDSLRYDVTEDKPRFEVNATGWIFLRADLADASAGTVELNVTASCTTGNGSDVSTSTLVTIDIHAPPGGGVAANVDLDDSAIKKLCFEGFPDAFNVEENVKDISLGNVNSCAVKDGYERTYTLAKKPRKWFTIDPVTSELLVTKAIDREALRTGTKDQTRTDQKGEFNISGVQSRKWFTIDPVTSELLVTKAIDREALRTGTKDQTQTDTKGEFNISGVQPIRVRCSLARGSRLFPAVTRGFQVRAVDVDDSPPVFYKLNDAQLKEVDIDLGTDRKEIKVGEMVLDLDDCRDWNATYRIDVISDPLHVCRPNVIFMCGHGKTFGFFSIESENLDAIPDTYRCQVGLVDTGFEPTADTNVTNQVVLSVNFTRPPPPKTPEVQSFKAAQTVNFYRNATQLARLLQVSSDASALTSPRGATYSLSHPIFKVTPRTGIVYVDNVEALAGADDAVSLSVVKSDGVGVNVIVNMYGTARDDIYACDDMCAHHDTKTSCEASCGFGLGTGSGGCTMRGSETDPNVSRHYGTCTYDVTRCPDGTCDELEELYPMLCPQDCTVEKVVGFGRLDQSMNPPRGIEEAKSPCWCDNTIKCFCMPYMDNVPKPPYQNPVNPVIGELLPATATPTSGDKRAALAKTLTQLEAVTTLYNITDQSQMVALVTEETTPTCGKACGTAIGLGLGAVIAISFSLFMLWFTKRRNDRRKNNLKHVGSVVSMSAVPSDYVEDRERQMSYSSPSWSPKGPINTSHLQGLHYEHNKWEIPRENLTLEKTLGEGEFGLVMKARASGIGGDSRPREVAVKMLKHCSTQLEEQDLWSEFTLLTDVSHPNVIHLLGACTGDGPFYVIVEYCEHGCLLKYLRRSRLVENGYINTRIRYKSPNAAEQTDPELEGDLLDLRDLLSFAWQIAKGMSYLSEIKLVHRDLAARNVLVAGGKVLKISDFGLTRDVYEADTYLKKSRGRIPVKWLAPESLYAQIYTTRSDVWSYGIVLWEIVTLGAPPYPGIPPERLYNLLMGGYRMDRPENCPDEMYAVMQKCWKIDAADRPPFACLANIFDRILQEKTGYLDLSQGNSHVQDLYSKCFDSTGNVVHGLNTAITNTPTSHNADVDVHRPSPDDVIDNIKLTTVSNELYNQETYLEPTSPLPSDNNKTVPLLGPTSELRTEVSNATTADNKDGNTPDKPDINEKSDKPDNNSENSDKTGKDVPLFIKKMLDNKSPANNRGNSSKNKNVIYPCEKLSLLMGNGTARFSTSVTELSEEPEETLRIEIE